MESVTIKDVARESGYSITTVSRVLSGSDYPVSADARDAIERCAARMGYVPNQWARSLKTNSSREIAVIMPSLRNPFYTTLVTSIESSLSQNGYNMLVFIRKRHAPDVEGFLKARYVALYDGIKQGAFARYFDREALSMYLVKKVFLEAREGPLMEITQLCMEEAVGRRIARERKGVDGIRRKAYEQVLDQDFEGNEPLRQRLPPNCAASSIPISMVSGNTSALPTRNISDLLW